MGRIIEHVRSHQRPDHLGVVIGGSTVDAMLTEHDAEVAALVERAERAEAARQRDAGLAAEHLAEARLVLADRAALVERAEKAEAALTRLHDDLATLTGRRHVWDYGDVPASITLCLAGVSEFVDRAETAENERGEARAQRDRVTALLCEAKADRDRLAAELEAVRGSGGVLTREECERLGEGSGRYWGYATRPARSGSSACVRHPTWTSGRTTTWCTMADQKTPAAIAAGKIVDDLREWRLEGCDAFMCNAVRAAWTAIIAQAMLDACEQAAPRVRAEERADVVEQIRRLTRFAEAAGNTHGAAAFDALRRVVEAGAHVGLAGGE